MKPDQLYPLKFQPILKERLWGGSKLGTLLNKPIQSDQTGESWEISGVPGDVSMVANGPLRDLSLQNLIDRYGEELLGTSVVERFGTEFPILIKFIDARKDLSIQLHPGDDLARKRHQSFGKTEMWYIMDADDDARLIIGFNRDIRPDEYKKSLEDDSLIDLLHYENVQEGDSFMIHTGKVHAIGGGILLAEIQQTSDVTYRIFDFNRRDSDGNYRELHTELALEAIDYRKKDDFNINYQDIPNDLNVMVNTPYFNTNYLRLDKDMKLDVQSRSSFSIYLCVDGQAEFVTPAGSEKIFKGETVLIPANSKLLEIHTEAATLLEVTI